MSVAETENIKLQVDLQAVQSRLTELEGMFLVTTTKLGTICSRMAVNASLPLEDFGPAVEARLVEMREQRTLWDRQADERKAVG